ncbi:MAG: M20/M25/M40 family metallo-hydrolase [Chitinophagaceae bacterium]
MSQCTTCLGRLLITSQKLKDIVYQLLDDSLNGRFWNTKDAVKASEIIAGYIKKSELRWLNYTNEYFYDIRFEDAAGPLLRNVIGILPGKSDKNEVVIFSAHYDHLGKERIEASQHAYRYLISGNTKDTIYNCANDNASGVAALLTIAAYFSKKGPQERTILFAAFSREESGMVGSKLYAEDLEPSIIVANINLEMLGRPDTKKSKPFITGADLSDLRSILNNGLFSAAGIEKYFQRESPSVTLFRRSDNISFALRG